MPTFVNSVSGSREFALSRSISSVCPIFSRLTFIVWMEALPAAGGQEFDCVLCSKGASKNILNTRSSKETTFICHTFITTCRHGRRRKTLLSCAGCMKQCGVLDDLLDLALHQSVNLDPVACSHTFFFQKIQDTLCNGSSGADTQKY